MSVTFSGGITFTGGGFSFTAAPPPTATNGWWAGGAPSNSAVSRITFATDTDSATTRGPLAFSQFDGPGSTGNGNYGWFGGGYTPGLGTLSSVDRVDYSNDTITASTRGNTGRYVQDLGATANIP